MRQRHPKRANELLPTLLSRLAAKSENAAGLKTLWATAVGAIVAQKTSPHRLENGVLIVQVKDARWARELEDQRSEIEGRIAQALEPGLVREIRFVLAG